MAVGEGPETAEAEAVRMEATVGLDVEVDRRNEGRSRHNLDRMGSWHTLNLVLHQSKFHFRYTRTLPTVRK